MRHWLITVLIGVNPIVTFSQNSEVIAYDDELILKSESGLVIDTLDDKSTYIIKNDTLTLFRLARNSSPDHCSSFSIMRERYKKERHGFGKVERRTTWVHSKCTNLWDENNIYCLQLIDFKLKKEIVTITIVDSNDSKLKARIEVNDDFEIQLKSRLDKFITKPECNGVRIE